MAATKYETKMRKALKQLGTSFLLYHLYRKDRDQWADFYTPENQSFIKGTDSPARRKMRLSLAPFMEMKIKRNSQGRQQYSCRITEANLAAIIEKFGPVPDATGKPFEPKKVEEKPVERVTAFNPASIGQPMQNSYEWDEEVQRRRTEKAKKDADEKKAELEKNKADMKALYAGKKEVTADGDANQET